jgi:isopentenyl phosphate kinase
MPDYNTAMNTTSGTLAGAELVFLKLGGSLITDKLSPRTARLKVIQRLCTEIDTALIENPGLKILLGHGSGSFGHFSGNKYGTREGVRTIREWRGFAEVWQDASTLNHLVMDALHQAGVPAVAFPPSYGVSSKGRSIQSWNLDPIQKALEKQLVPVVYGDVVFDDSLGGTILSTEDLFIYLAAHIIPTRILLAGHDPGVWEDYPECTRLYEQLRPSDRVKLRGKISQSAATDVTGGMADKVNLILDLISDQPALKALIFSGEEPGSILQALVGDYPGTLLLS